VTGVLGTAHRNVIVNMLARIAPDGLGAIAGELEQVSPAAAAHGLAASLADLARTRRAMLDELTVSVDPSAQEGG